MTTIAEVMTPDATTIPPDADLRAAAEMMRDLDVGALPVHDGSKLLSMITDRDITVRATAEGKAPGDCNVADVMSTDAAWCFEDQSAGEVLQLMGERQVRRIPVLRRASGELVGVVSLGDLATRQDGSTDSTLEAVSSPLPPTEQPTGKQPDWP